MKSYHDKNVFKESKKLAIVIHKMSRTLPKFELYEEESQIRRSAKAVTSLIIEGYGRRRYKRDFIKYSVFCQSEFNETIVPLDFLFKTGFLKNGLLYNEPKTGYKSSSNPINKFIHWAENNLNNFTKPAN